MELQFTWAPHPGADGGEVTAPVAASGKVRGIPGVHADLVGRDAELASAVRVVEAARAGTGGVLFICGEVGVGKSRLLSELHRHTGGSRPSGRPSSLASSTGSARHSPRWWAADPR